MRRWIIMLAPALLALVLATVAFAQDATPTPAPADAAATQSSTDSITDTEVLTVTETLTAADGITDDESITVVRSLRLRSVDVSLLTLDLEAGFPLDPFFVSVNGGGSEDASELDPACSGYVNPDPVLTVNWTGEATQVYVFAYSDHNPSLVIERPDGSFLCNEDAGDAVFDPQVVLPSPAAGTYRIWIGSQRPLDLIPTVLVLTTHPEFGLSYFSLDNFVAREAVPVMKPTVADALPESKAYQERLSTRLAEATDLPELTADAPLTASVMVTGTRAAILLPASSGSPAPLCAGLINDVSQLDFTAGEDVTSARIFFEGANDATLAVITPDGLVFCVDDSPDGANLNPLIDLTDMAPGNYAVVVGRLSAVDALEGVVTVTTDLEAAPAQLDAPAASEESQP